MAVLKKRFFASLLWSILSVATLWSSVAMSASYCPVDNPVYVILSAGGVSLSPGSNFEWTPDFTVLGSRAAGQYMADMFAGDFGLTHEQANQVFVHSNNGTAIAAWGEIAGDRPLYETMVPSTEPGDAWRWLRQIVTEYEESSYRPHVFGTQYAANINSITGAGFVGVVDAGILSASAINDQVIGSRLAQLKNARRNKEFKFGGVGAFGSPSNQYSGTDFSNGIWAAPFMTIQDVDERNGYAPYQFQAFGTALGYDHTIGDLTVGGAFVYNRGRNKDKWVVASEGITDNYALTLYGTYRPIANLFVDASGGFQYGKNRYKRYLASYAGGTGVVDADFVDQKNHTDTWWIGGKVGYDFNIWKNVILTPSAGLLYQSATGSSFTSHSRAPGVNNTFERMHVGKISKAALVLPLDLYASATFDLNPCSSLSFRAGGGLHLNLKRDAATGSMRYVDYSQKVDIVGAKPGGNVWNVGAGATYQTRRFDVSLDYKYEGGWKSGHFVNGGIAVKF